MPAQHGSSTFGGGEMPCRHYREAGQEERQDRHQVQIYLHGRRILCQEIQDDKQGYYQRH
jgi:hypothetical protein